MLEKILSILNAAGGKPSPSHPGARALSAAEKAELRELFKKDLDAAITREKELAQRAPRHSRQRSIAA